MSRKYWIGVASEDHVIRGVEGGFAQVCHGKAGPLKRMRTNDVIIYYSPRRIFGEKDPYQSFTAIGKIIDGEVYQVQMSADFAPFRINVEFYPKIQSASIHPLIEQLSFITDKKYYGRQFRYGHLEISKSDAMIIWNAMEIIE